MIFNKNKLFSYIIFFMLSLFVLNTYYFYNIGLPIVQLLGLPFLIYIYYIYGLEYKKVKTPFHLLSAFIILISFTTLINIALLDTIASPIAFIGLLLCFMVFLFNYSLNIPNNLIYNIITKLTMLLLLFWSIQFLTFYIFEYKLDYFIDIVDYKQRTNLGAFGQGFFRPSSLFVEPAMYANAMLLLFYYRLIYNDFRLDKINIFILFSIFMTLSTYGYVVFGILGLLWLFVRKKYIVIVFFAISLMLLFLFFIGELESNMIIRRILNPLEDMSGQSRVIGNIFSFSEQSIFHLLFGFGWGNAELNSFQGSAIHYLLYNAGIFGLLTFVMMMYLILKNKKYRNITLLVLLLSLINNSSTLTSFFNWAMLGIIFRLSTEEIYKRKQNATTK